MNTKTQYKSKSRKDAVSAGFRSAFEQSTANQLKAAKIEFKYEPREHTIGYTLKANGICVDCGCKAIVTNHKYLPDFVINEKVIVETKGKWDAQDRKKAIEICNNTDYTLVLLFQNPLQKITKRVNYGKWCDLNNIKWLSSKEDWVSKLKQIIKDYG